MTRGLIHPNIARALLFSYIILILGHPALGQSLTAGTVSGTVNDPNNAVRANSPITSSALSVSRQSNSSGPQESHKRPQDTQRLLVRESRSIE
jgi:hypothetical protein